MNFVLEVEKAQILTHRRGQAAKQQTRNSLDVKMSTKNATTIFIVAIYQLLAAYARGTMMADYRKREKRGSIARDDIADKTTEGI